jgi:NAD(P)-dependent dehydrogenase (short-subunit alcohol dehydrogenase family)
LGAAVVIDYVGNASISKDTISRIDAMEGKSLGIEADISIPEQVNALIHQTVAAFGKLDIFVNNAGIEKKFAFVDYPLEEWQKIMAVNLTGPFLCSQAAAKQMIVQGAAAASSISLRSMRIFPCRPTLLIAHQKAAFAC